MAVDLEALKISPDATVRDAVARLDANATGILVMVDSDEHLLGTITDGDIRRGLLAEVGMDASIQKVAFKEPTTVSPEAGTAYALRILNRLKIRHLPVVDGEGRFVGMHLLAELAQRIGGAAELPLSAVIMAGGLGKRLRPLTEDTPKPLIEVGGKPILERSLEHLAEAGVEDVFITTGYLGEQIEAYFGAGAKWDLHITYVREKERLGTAGALKLLEGELDRSFLVMNGDLLTNFSVAEMLDFHRDEAAQMTVGVRHYEFQVPYGVADVEGVAIKRLQEKPTYEFFVNAGVYMLEPELIERIPASTYFDITELIDELIADDGKVLSFPIVERWLDIGRPEDVDKANEKYFGGE
jgi:dTDP-glucose pyrophosphorylase